MPGLRQAGGTVIGAMSKGPHPHGLNLELREGTLSSSILKFMDKRSVKSTRTTKTLMIWFV